MRAQPKPQQPNVQLLNPKPKIHTLSLPHSLLSAALQELLPLSLFLLFPFLFLLPPPPPATLNHHTLPRPSTTVPLPQSLVSFLERLQETTFNNFGKSNFDPKTYVDLPLKFPLSVTEHAFQNLPKTLTGSVRVDDLKRFTEAHFEGAGDDLVYLDPEDFVSEPEGFLPKVKHPEIRAWVLQVHSLWKNLSRKIFSAVMTHPNLHTLLPLPGSVVIPGSRFREVYYWDSYWV